MANCVSCHSQRDPIDGSYLGPKPAGGSPMPLDDDPGVVLVPLNLTPDPVTGHISSWTAVQFVARFRAGRTQPGSHMPWMNYARMSDTDLRAIHAYLRSLEPVENDTGPIRRAADDQRTTVAGGRVEARSLRLDPSARPARSRNREENRCSTSSRESASR